MSLSRPLSPPLIKFLWPGAQAEKGIGQQVALCVLGTFLLALSAKIRIPLLPVQLSMQSFAVIFLSALYGRNLGLMTVALYLIEGACGLPVFQGTPERGLGIPYMMGPTGGYLLGFLVSGYGVGTLAERGWGKSLISAAGLFWLGAVLIDLPGITWLGITLGPWVAYETYLSYQLAFLLKTGLGTCLLPQLWKFGRTP